MPILGLYRDTEAGTPKCSSSRAVLDQGVFTGDNAAYQQHNAWLTWYATACGLASVGGGEGRQESHDVSGAGGKIRFAFGRPGRRSGVWVVLANKNKSDVYVFGRTIAGVEKSAFTSPETGGTSGSRWGVP